MPRYVVYDSLEPRKGDLSETPWHGTVWVIDAMSRTDAAIVARGQIEAKHESMKFCVVRLSDIANVEVKLVSQFHAVYIDETAPMVRT